MRHETQVETLQTLLRLRQQGRHQEMLGEVVQIPVSVYTGADLRHVTRIGTEMV